MVALKCVRLCRFCSYVAQLRSGGEDSVGYYARRSYQEKDSKGGSGMMWFEVVLQNI